MSKILGYVLVGLGSAAVASGATYFVTRRVVSKSCKQKYEKDLANQLNGCRQYYKRKISAIKNGDEAPAEEPESTEVEVYDTVEEAEQDNDIDGIVVRDENSSKRRASEIAQEIAVQNYHKMYGEPTVDTIFDDDDEPDDLPEIPNKGPHCVLKEEGWDNDKRYEQVEIHLYTGDFIRKDDGEKEYLEIFYCNGYLLDKRDENGNPIPISLDDPWRERVIKSSEAAAIFGDEWRKWIGNDEWDEVNKYGFDYEPQEACICNDDLKTYFFITRMDEMYKVVIEGKEPGEPFNYDSIR